MSKDAGKPLQNAKKGWKNYIFWGQQKMLGIMVGVLKKVLKDVRKGIELETFTHILLIIIGKQ